MLNSAQPPEWNYGSWYRNPVSPHRKTWASSERCTMPLNKSRISVMVKIAVLIWGGVILIKGAEYEFFIRENDPYATSTSIFSNLTYGTLFLAALLSFLSTRIASLLLLLSVIASSAILIWTNTFGHGLPWANPFIWDIARGPGLGSLVLFVVSRWVKDPPIADKLRSLVRK